MSFQALQSLAKLQDLVGRRAGREGLSDEQGRTLGKDIRNLFAIVLYCELQLAVVPKELISQICRWCSEKTRSQLQGFLRHGMRVVANHGLQLAPLKVIHFWKNGTWWHQELATCVGEWMHQNNNGGAEHLRLRLKGGNLLSLNQLQWITERDFPASIVFTDFKECPEDPIESLKQAVPPGLRNYMVDFQWHQEHLLGQRLWLLRSHLMAQETGDRSHALAETNDAIIRMLTSSFWPRAMLSHNWAPVRDWLRRRFHVKSDVLTRIFTVAGKVVAALVRDLDQSVKVSVPSQRAHGWTVHHFQSSNCGASQHPTFVPAVQMTHHPMSPQVPAVQMTHHQMSPQVPAVQMTHHQMSQHKADPERAGRAARQLPVEGSAMETLETLEEERPGRSEAIPRTPVQLEEQVMATEQVELSKHQTEQAEKPQPRQRWGDLQVPIEGEEPRCIDLQKYDEALRGAASYEATESQQLSPTAQPP